MSERASFSEQAIPLANGERAIPLANGKWTSDEARHRASWCRSSRSHSGLQCNNAMSADEEQACAGMARLLEFSLGKGQGAKQGRQDSLT